MKLSEFLELAWKKIEDPAHWTQGHYARNEAGMPTPVKSDDACKFCAVGACLRVDFETCQDLELRASDLLSQASAKLFESYNIVAVNDGYMLGVFIQDRHEAIKQAYKLAIKWTKDAENVGCEAR